MTEQKFVSEIKNIIGDIDALKNYEIYGVVKSVKGAMIEIAGLAKHASIGAVVEVVLKDAPNIRAEIISINSNICIGFAFESVNGVNSGCKVKIKHSHANIWPDESWLGRVINSSCEPIDGKAPLAAGKKAYDFKNSEIDNPHDRNKVEDPLSFGVKAFDTFTTCCKGQRMGIFAGSGVGKSIMISMMTKFSEADVKVIGLVGERGREVKEFIEDYLGSEGLKSAIIVVETSDKPALAKRNAALITMTIAEYFRDLGKDVLCIIDSVTRFAYALREIGLAIGQPPGPKGYTASVFTELPKLLERAGPSTGEGSITGLFSVLVDGDDHNEPVADSVRGILDGHIILERKIAERGRFPAINVLKSVSRTMPNCQTDEEYALVKKCKQFVAEYENMEEIIKIGAYKIGSNAKVDDAIFYYDKIEGFLNQLPNEGLSKDESFEKLREIFQEGVGS